MANTRSPLVLNSQKGLKSDQAETNWTVSCLQVAFVSMCLSKLYRSWQCWCVLQVLHVCLPPAGLYGVFVCWWATFTSLHFIICALSPHNFRSIWSFILSLFEPLSFSSSSLVQNQTALSSSSIYSFTACVSHLCLIIFWK